MSKGLERGDKLVCVKCEQVIGYCDDGMLGLLVCIFRHLATSEHNMSSPWYYKSEHGIELFVDYLTQKVAMFRREK